jgi:hypothetical protein
MNVSVLVVSQGTGTRSILGVTTPFAIIIPLDTMAMEIVFTAAVVAMMIAVLVITIMIVVIPVVDHVVIVRIFTKMVDREATTAGMMIVVAVKESEITIMNVDIYVESFFSLLRSFWP